MALGAAATPAGATTISRPLISVSASRVNRIRTCTFGPSPSPSTLPVSRISLSLSAPAPTSSSASVTGGSGLFGVSTPRCGASNASSNSTTSGGPNGAEAWLNCGLSNTDKTSAWTPPTIHLSQLRTLDLSTAQSMDNSVYTACKPYVGLFEKYGEREGVPPILLAAFAMQESSCNPSTTGDDGGAYGLMQITADKCGDAPDGDCSDPEYNIKTAAAYFASTLAAHNSNFLLALGSYNGWHEGMTYDAAIAVRETCCECQQNLDYMQQMLNGWLLGYDGSQFGTVRNVECD
ncbi:hypothetical protein JCM21900_006563 [Sporobolomyces salmonicolor]